MTRSIDPDLGLLHKPCNIGPNLFTLYKVCKGLGIYEKMAKPSQRFAYRCLDNDKISMQNLIKIYHDVQDL